jgi:hypothetical protein
LRTLAWSDVEAPEDRFGTIGAFVPTQILRYNGIGGGFHRLIDAAPVNGGDVGAH